MSHTEAEKDFKEAIKLYHNHFVAEALEMMKKALEEEPGNPVYLSHLGVLMAQAKKNYTMAEKLCSQALKKKHNDPELHLNLANVYVDAGRYDDAVHALEQGLKYTKQNKRLKQRLRQLGDRRPPIIPFLGRGNFLNVQLGKLRHSIMDALDHD
jgi:predicted Zn-dependent protease